MFIVISPSNPDPMHKQVTDQVKDAIARGAVAAGEKLPSIREMSRELKTSPITIKRSYRDLEREGYIITRAGLGSFVAEVNMDSVRKEKLASIKKDIEKILSEAGRYGIRPDEIIGTIREIEESSNE